jgi:hypothetical protein
VRADVEARLNALSKQWTPAVDEVWGSMVEMRQMLEILPVERFRDADEVGDAIRSVAFWRNFGATGPCCSTRCYPRLCLLSSNARWICLPTAKVSDAAPEADARDQKCVTRHVTGKTPGPVVQGPPCTPVTVADGRELSPAAL